MAVGLAQHLRLSARPGVNSNGNSNNRHANGVGPIALLANRVAQQLENPHNNSIAIPAFLLEAANENMAPQAQTSKKNAPQSSNQTRRS